MPDALLAFAAGAAIALALSSLTNLLGWGPRATPIDQAATAIMVGGAVAGSHLGGLTGHALIGVVAGVLAGGVAATLLRMVARPC